VSVVVAGHLTCKNCYSNSGAFRLVTTHILSSIFYLACRIRDCKYVIFGGEVALTDSSCGFSCGMAVDSTGISLHCYAFSFDAIVG